MLRLIRAWCRQIRYDHRHPVGSLVHQSLEKSRDIVTWNALDLKSRVEDKRDTSFEIYLTSTDLTLIDSGMMFYRSLAWHMRFFR